MITFEDPTLDQPIFLETLSIAEVGISELMRWPVEVGFVSISPMASGP